MKYQYHVECIDNKGNIVEVFEKFGDKLDFDTLINAVYENCPEIVRVIIDIALADPRI